MHIAGSTRRKALHAAMLAGTALALGTLGIAQAVAAPGKKPSDTELARAKAKDDGNAGPVTESVTMAPPTNDLVGDVELIGIDLGNGADNATVVGTSEVDLVLQQSVSTTEAALDADFAATAIGVDAGRGRNKVLLAGDMSVESVTISSQTDFDFILERELNSAEREDIFGVTHARAIGVTAIGGALDANNQGNLLVEAKSTSNRTDVGLFDIEFELFGLEGDGEVALIALAEATGISGAPTPLANNGARSFSDFLVNDAGGTIAVIAQADSQAVGVSLLGAPSIAATRPIAIATGMDGVDGNDTLMNLGAIQSDAITKSDIQDWALGFKTYDIEIAAPGSDAALNPADVPRAHALGLAGGNGDDLLTNEGTIDVNSYADWNKLGVTIDDGGIELSAAAFLVRQAKSGGGSGNPNAQQVEDIGALFQAESDGAIALITGMEGDAAFFGIDSLPGVRGVGGYDQLFNDGVITGTAFADTDNTIVTIGLPLADIVDSGVSQLTSNAGVGTAVTTAFNGFNIGMVDESADAAALAQAMRGSGGDDKLVNRGEIDITADADTNLVIVQATLFSPISANDGPDSLFAFGVPLTNLSANALALTEGLSGGLGDDILTNIGDLKVTADADASIISVSAAFANEDSGLQVEVPVMFAQSRGTAFATGIDGGAGNDLISNSGAIDVEAVANAEANNGDLIVGHSKGAGTINAFVMDKSIYAIADAAGIRDGLGIDTVLNDGFINSLAEATTLGVTVNAAVSVDATGGVAGSGGFLKTTQVAQATSAGIVLQRGQDEEQGSLSNRGQIFSQSIAQSTRSTTSISASFVGTSGAALSASVVDAENIAIAKSTAVRVDTIAADGVTEANSFAPDGGAFVAWGDMWSYSDAEAYSADLVVNGSFTASGLGVGVAAIQGSSRADSDATLISFGVGNDAISNRASLIADAGALVDSLGISLAVGAANGLAVGASLFNTSLISTARAQVIDSGAGDDAVSNTTLADGVSPATLEAIAFSKINSTEVGLTGAVAPTAGVAVGASLARANLASLASAAAVDLVSGSDSFVNIGETLSDADSVVTQTGVDLTLSLAAVGVSVAGTLSDSSLVSASQAFGARGGDGSDELANGGLIATWSDAKARRTDISITGSFTAGLALGGSYAKSDLLGFADSAVMDGEGGSDFLWNLGTATGYSYSDTDNIGVALDVSISANFAAAGVTAVDAQTRSQAVAVGLSGGARDLLNDAIANGDGELDGADEIYNLGDLDIDAIADAFNGSFSATISVVGVVGLAADTSSDATAIGLYGGLGGDLLVNEGNAWVDAQAFTDGASFSLIPNGLTFGSFTTLATAQAVGFSGWDGDDALLNTGLVDVSSLAELSNTSISANLIGANFSSAQLDAFSNSTGLAGGLGNDLVVNAGEILSEASSDLAGSNYEVSVVAVQMGSTAALSRANAFGMDGGQGDDRLENHELVTALSDAGISGTSFSLNLTGGTIVDLRNTAEGNAVGLAGDSGADILINRGHVDTDAMADATASRTSLIVAGASVADGQTSAIANASGLSGGEGADSLLNEGSVDADAKATAAVTELDITLIGANISTGTDASTLGSARAVGLEGRAGDDGIENTGSIDANASSQASANSDSVVIAGAGLIDASTQLNTDARGIDGGAGNDWIASSGSILAKAVTDSDARSYAFTLIGAGGANATTTSSALSTGIYGGAGNDTVFVEGTIESIAEAIGFSSSVTSTGLGASLGDARSNTLALANGMAGGAGDDVIANFAAVTSTGKATAQARTVDATFIGAPVGDNLESRSATFAAGMSGGLGADQISNDASITATATAVTNGDASDTTIIGASDTASTVASSAQAVGLQGFEFFDLEQFVSPLSDGDDLLVNNASGIITTASSATITARNAAWNIIGTAINDSALSATSDASGMQGGFGNDTLVNFGTIDAKASAVGRLQSTAFTAIGTVRDGSTSGPNVLARSWSMQGEGGSDALYFSGIGTSIADANIDVRSSSEVGLGDYRGDLPAIVAIARASGLDGGDDDDYLELDGILSIAAKARVTSSNTRSAFAGSSIGKSSAGAISEARGLIGGAGDDALINRDKLTLRADSTATGSGSARTTIGGNNNLAGSLAARGSIFAIEGGVGEDFLANFGSISATTYTTVRATNSVTSAFLFSDGIARSFSETQDTGALFYDYSGNTMVLNDGEATIRSAFDDLATLGGVSRAEATGNAFSGSIDADARASAVAKIGANIGAVDLGADDHVVMNTGILRVVAQPRGSASATANGRASISGFGRADTTVTGNGMTAFGVRVEGALALYNSGVISVEFAPLGSASSTSFAQGFGFVDPDSFANITVSVSGNRAYGVRGGSREDYIENDGTISVELRPRADRALAQANPFSSGSLSVDAFATAGAYANNNYAFGIETRDGNDTVINRGLINVVSAPFAEAVARATGNGPDGDVSTFAEARAQDTRAFGIDTGDGDDWIENYGTVNVLTAPVAVADVTAKRGEECVGDACLRGENDSPSPAEVALIGLRSYGILTGDGDDTVIHGGSITVNGSTSGSNPIGHAILLGDGDDALVLLEGYSITGAVRAGAGNDLLVLSGNASFDAIGAQFENFSKTDGGISMLTVGGTLNGMVSVADGALVLRDATSSFGAGALTNLLINADGGHTSISSTGALELGGQLAVNVTRGLFVDGTVHNVISADGGLSGTFSSILLPQSTALVSFGTQSGRNRFGIRTDVAQMAKLAGSTDHARQSFAAVLDEITPIATGEIANQIAGLQLLTSAEDVLAIVGAMTPRMAVATQQPAILAANAASRATGHRLAEFRAGKGSPTVPATHGFAFRQADAASAGVTSWAARFDSSHSAFVGDASDAGLVQGHVHGFDVMAPSGLLLGASVSRMNVGATGTGRMGSSQVANWSLYGGYTFDDRSYMQLALNAGQSVFSGYQASLREDGIVNNRIVDRSNMMGIGLELGRDFDLSEGIAATAFGAFNHFAHTGGGFTGNDGSAFALRVDQTSARRTDLTAGFRLNGRPNAAKGNLMPYLAVSWSHALGAVTDRALASFAGMPDHSFALFGEREARDRINVEAGLSIGTVGRWQLSAQSRAEFSALRHEASTQIEARIRF